MHGPSPSTAPCRIGLMVPANNTTMEQEFPLWLSRANQCRMAHIPRGAALITPATIPAYRDRAYELARGLRGNTDVVVYGCTAAGFMMGPSVDAEVAVRLREIVEVPVVTTASAMIAALQSTGARKVAVLTPYPTELNRQLETFLGAFGIEVSALDTFAARNTDELGAITADRVAARAAPLLTEDADALFIACSQLPTHAVLDDIQQKAGKRPVWSSIKASAWQVEKVLGEAEAGHHASPHSRIKSTNIFSTQ